MELDLSNMMVYVLELLGMLMLSFGSWALRRYGKNLGLRNDSEIRGYLLDTMERAVNYGLEVAKDRGEDLSDIKVRDNIVWRAVDYALERVPDALAHFDLDNPEKLAETLRSRLIVDVEEVE